MFKRILLVLASLLLILFISGFVVFRYFEDDVVEYALEKAKTRFVTRVDFGSANLAFWETFPNASLKLNDVLIEETFEASDTLIYARSLFLEFNLFDLFRSEYNVHTVDIADAVCNLKVDAKGHDNWHFWKENAGDTSLFKLELEEVDMENTRFSYSNTGDQFKIAVTANEFSGKGDFTGQRFDLEMDLEGLVHELSNAGESYAIERTFQLEALLDADTKAASYVIKECDLELGKLKAGIAGKINTSDNPSIELEIAGQDIEMEDLIASLPASQKKKFDAYAPDGELDLKMSLKQKGKNKPLMTDVHFTIRDGRLKHQESGVALSNIVTDMRYTSGGKRDQLRINSLGCNLGIGYMRMEGTVTDMTNPELELAASMDMNMEDLRDFLALDTLELCQGHLVGDARIAGRLNYIKEDTAYDWRSVLASGSVRLENGLIRLKNSNREFTALQADVKFNNKDAVIQNLSGNVNGSDFRINGDIFNLLPFLASPDERIVLDARMNCNNLDFTNLVETDATTSTSNNYKFELPARIDFTLNTSINRFAFRQFEATSVKGIASLKQGALMIDPVSFNTADGRFSAQIAMERSGDEYYRLNCLAELSDINIKKLFTEFENFDQNFIQDKHLKGIAKATVQFRTMLTTSLEIMPDKVESLIDISIENGQLSNLESLQDIAVYVKSNKLIAPFVDEDKFSERMKDISFSKLENVIEIKNRMITIPLMDIRSSAMDISARGTHTFDNEIDYAIGFNLRDVLVRKEKDWQEVDDGLGKRLFIAMKGTTDDPQFSMDKELAKDVRREEMQAEKQNVKALLKEELGLFRKDKNVGGYQKEEQGTGTVTTLEWEGSEMEQKKNTEEPAKQVVQPKEDKSEPEKKKKERKWLQEKE